MIQNAITAERDPFSAVALGEILKFDPENDQRLSSRESGRLEFKEAFHFGSTDDYARTIAAFANSPGGYLVFGVKDKPRTLIGLKTEAFDNLDPAKFTQALNSLLAPEILWEPCLKTVHDKKVGIIYVHEARTKPVLCLKSTNEVQEGAIYYRYRGRTEKIKYPELRQLIENEREKERDLWKQSLQRMARIGIEHVGVLNSLTGEVSGGKGSFLISEELLPKIQFIHSGTFIESGGQPTLKLVGEAFPINPQLVQPTQLVRKPLHAPDILEAFVNRETVQTPLDYVKQICFEPSQFYPVHFFINQTSAKVTDVIAELDKVDCRPIGKNRLIERLNKNERLASGSLRATTEAGTRLRSISSSLVTKSLTDAVCLSNLRYFFYAITHLTRDKADPDFILPLIHRVALPQYSSLPSIDVTYMRKAICHLDIIWYKQASSNGAATDSVSAIK